MAEAPEFASASEPTLACVRRVTPDRVLPFFAGYAWVAVIVEATSQGGASTSSANRKSPWTCEGQLLRICAFRKRD